MDLWLAYVALGLFAGFVAGMFGIGGGILMVPILSMLFVLQGGFPSEIAMHCALGTSSAVIVFTSISSVRAHHAHQAVLWQTVATVAPGVVVGALFGATLASYLAVKPLAVFFTFFVVLAALQMIFSVRPKSSRELPKRLGLVTVGGAIGCVSSLVAIGGGTITVPFLVWCNVKVQQAIGTSAAVGLPLAMGSALGYILNGWGVASLPEWCVGYVYLPAFVLIIPFSMLMAPVGASLTHKLPVMTLKRLFAVLLVLLAGRMMWKLFA